MVSFRKRIIEFSFPEIEVIFRLLIHDLIAAFLRFFDQRSLAAVQVHFARIIKLRICFLCILDHFPGQKFIARTKNEVSSSNRILVKHKSHRQVSIQPETIETEIVLIHPAASDRILQKRGRRSVTSIGSIDIRHEFPCKLQVC